MRERVPVLRPGRGLRVAAAVLTLLLAGGAVAGCGGSGGGQNSDVTTARFAGFNLKFDYPSAWQRKNWCWQGNDLYPLTLLTTEAAVPRCQAITAYTQGTPLPPPQKIGANGVTAWWLAADKKGSARFTPNTTVDGKKARVTVQEQPTSRTARSYVNCSGSGKTQRFLEALIQGPNPNVNEVQLGAVICGPNFAAGEAQVRKMLKSLHFTS